MQITFEKGDVLLISMMDPSRQLQWANDIDVVSSNEKKSSPSESFSIVREFMVAMTLQWHSPLVGQSVVQAGLRGLPGLYLAALERETGEVSVEFFLSLLLSLSITILFMGPAKQSRNAVRSLRAKIEDDCYLLPPELKCLQCHLSARLSLSLSLLLFSPVL